MKRILTLLTISMLFTLTGCFGSFGSGECKYEDLFEGIEHGTRENVFTFSDSYITTIDKKISKLDSSIEKDSNALLISLYFNDFFNELLYVQEQYVIIHAYSMLFPNNESIKEDLAFLSTYLIELDQMRFSYLVDLINSQHRDSFFPDYASGEYDWILEREDLYDDEYYTYQLEVTKLELEYSALLNSDNKDYDELALKLVEKVNAENKVAMKLGFDNYIDYNYSETLNREYSYDDLSSLRVASQNISDVIIDLKKYVNELEMTDEEYAKYNLLSEGSFLSQKEEFDNLALFMGSDYLTNYNYFWNNGEYYFGDENSYDAAFIQKTASQSFVMCYFGPGYYSQLQTVVHEVGHYMAALEDYSDNSYDNIDLCEFQAQANEMLLASYVYNNNLDDVSYEAFAINEVASSLSVILSSLIVSDFESVIYNKNNLQASEISGIMSDIYLEYGVTDIFRDSDEYWAATSRYLTGYYISYGISVIPSIELFFEGMSDINKAKTDYIQIMKGKDEILPTISSLGYSNPLNSNIIEELINNSYDLIK